MSATHYRSGCIHELCIHGDTHFRGYSRYVYKLIVDYINALIVLVSNVSPTRLLKAEYECE